MPEKGDPGFTLASLLILAVLGMFAWKSAPLQSARPTNDKEEVREHEYDDEVPARLWQDPFNALDRHKRALAALVERGGARKKKLSLQDDVDHAIAQPEQGTRELVVIVATVNPDSYAEIQERRRRRRYAILSALGDSGFVPRAAESLGLFRLVTEECDSPGVFQPRPAKCEESAIDLPYEWYDFEDPTSTPRSERSAVLLWLDESWLGDKPFEQIWTLVEQLLETNADRRHVTWVTIGPSSSGTLRSMVREKSEAVEKLSKSGLAAFYILSPAATVDDCELNRNLKYCKESGEQACKGKDERDKTDPSPLLGDYFTKTCDRRSDHGQTCMRFLRTIRSDADLITELGSELKRRGVDAEDPVVVISEWDTYFGRSLPRSLARVLAKKDPRLLRRYTYERGIDGITLGEEAAQLRAASGSGAGSKGSDAAPVRRPLGTGQFDYLRRLAKVVREDDERFRIDTGRGVKVVAVLGSDVFDKLLILRALRNELPGAIWITTDLDANLLHEDEFPWARNLVVASTYDFKLPASIQSATPPFRDSYQTSAYLAARMAVDERLIAEHWPVGSGAERDDPFPGQQEMYESLPPLLFEVGRNGVVPLKTELLSSSDGRPAPITYEEESPRIAYFVGAFLIAVLAIVALHQVRPRSGRIVLVLSAVLLIMSGVLLVALATAMGGEPVDLQAGVSVWPTIMIRLLILVLVAVFIWSVLRRLDYNWKELNHRYFGGPEPPTDDGLTVREAWQRGWLRVRPRPWAVGCLLLLVALISIMLTSRIRTAGALPTLGLQAILFTILITLWWLFMYGTLRSDVRVRSINRWMNQKHAGSAVTLWRRYRQYGETQHRMLRSAGVTLLYFVFGSIVFLLLGGGAAPCRGPVACGLNGFVLGLSVVLMLFLLFLVVDAIRLCVCWIEKLRDPNLHWHGARIDDLARKRQLPASHAECWLLVHLIGERTREVGRLLYYPLIVILLMLLARSTYFDDWDFPVALAIVIGINFLIALTAAAILNHTARLAREEILERLRNESLELTKEETEEIPPATASEIDQLIDKLSKLNLGAYQRVWEQPLVRALVLLLSGLGLTFSEYSRLLN